MDLVPVSLFKYQPLAEPDSIRLLTLQPGLPGAEIHCDVEQRSLPECDDIYDY